MKNKGFTLIELMITITIMLIMTATVLFNYNKFNESSLLNAFAYDLSLTIRQAQVYGIAVREGLDGQNRVIDERNYESLSESFGAGYGVHFDKSEGDDVVPLRLFIDTLGEGKYDAGDVDVEIYKFQRGIKIGDLCVNVLGVEQCNKDVIDITFKRPDPEATIVGRAILGGEVDGSRARITLQNADGDIVKHVIVESTGQISVQ